MTQRIAILGSTGSIGVSTLDLFEQAKAPVEIVAIVSPGELVALVIPLETTGGVAPSELLGIVAPQEGAGDA